MLLPKKQPYKCVIRDTEANAKEPPIDLLSHCLWGPEGPELLIVSTNIAEGLTLPRKSQQSFL